MELWELEPIHLLKKQAVEISMQEKYIFVYLGNYHFEPWSFLLFFIPVFLNH